MLPGLPVGLRIPPPTLGFDRSCIIRFQLFRRPRDFVSEFAFQDPRVWRPRRGGPSEDNRSSGMPDGAQDRDGALRQELPPAPRPCQHYKGRHGHGGVREGGSQRRDSDSA